MKQENGKKSKKWLLPVLIAVALVAIAGILLAVLLPGQGGQSGAEATGGRPSIYWNHQGASYIEAETGMSTRERQDDGFYHINLLVDGQEKEFLCADKQLINYMDTMTTLVLTFDANGYIIDALDAKEAKDVVTRIADGFYVQRIEGNVIVINTSFAMNGMELRLEMTDLCKIYNMDSKADSMGKEDIADIMDRVTVFGLDEQTPTHIFIVERAPQTGVYFRTTRMYDSATGMTTREPDENGVYTIQFAHNGQLVDIKCKDKTLVTSIDAQSPLIGEVAPILDEEGYLVDTVNVILALRGKMLAQDYHVIEVLGNNTYKLERISSGSDQGKVITVTLGENCNIYNVCQYGGCCSFVGEKSEGLQMYDRLNLYADLEGNPILAHVTRRLAEVPVFWNLKRMYTSADGGSTTRVPDAQGYYIFDMLQDGKPVTVRTKDKAIATQIDYPYDTTVGLELDGDIVTKVYAAKEVIGSYSPGYRRCVTSLTGNIMTLTNAEDATISTNVIMTADCKVYDVTGNPGVKKGTPTEVKLGDRVISWYNYREQVSYVFVTDRAITIREYCEYCQKKVTWEVAPKNGLSTIDTGKHLHYVLGEDVDVEWGYGVLSKGTTLCLNLYGSNISHATRIFVAGGSKLNLMGKGTILSTGIHQNESLKTGNITVSDGEVNIYPGVTVKSGKANMPAIYLNGKNAVVNLHGGKVVGTASINQGLLNLAGKTTVKNIYIGTTGKLNVKESWTGEATLQVAVFTLDGISKTYATSEGAYTGKMTYVCEGNPAVIGEDGGLVVVGGIIPDESDPNYRMCNHCGQKVMWVEAPASGHATVDTGEHMHYYLTQDFDRAWGYMTLSNNTTICLDLNGYTVKQTGRILVGSGALNIMGEGKIITQAHTNAGLNTGGITIQKGEVNIYGGNYISAGDGIPALHVTGKDAVVNLNGGTFSGGVRITTGALNLDGATKVLGTAGERMGNIRVAAGGLLNVKATWTGEASMQVEVLEDGGISADNGSSEGAYTGKLYYESKGEPAILGKDGLLEVQGEVIPSDDDPNYRWCEHCGKKVLWTEAGASGLSEISSGKHLHLWLKKDTAELTWGYATLSKETEICLDLDGHTITQASRIYLSYANLNVMNGTIRSTNSHTNAAHNTGCITVGAGQLNLYNVNIISDNEVAPAISMLWANADVKLHKGATVVGGIHAGSGNLTLDGDAKADMINLADKGKLHVEKSWNGNAVLTLVTLSNPIVNADCTGAYTGTLYYNAEGTPRINGLDGKLYIEGYENIEPEETPIAPNFPSNVANGVTSDAWCEACQANVTWTSASSGLASRADGGHHHLFVSGSRDATDPLTWQLGTINSGTVVCLYLNDTVTVHNGRLFVLGGSTVNIMGKGALITNGTSTTSGALTGGVTINDGTVNVLGQITLSSLHGEVPAASVLYANAKLNLGSGSIIDGGVLAENGKLSLEGNVIADVIGLGKGCELAVDQSYSGTAQLIFKELYNPVVNSSCTGAFTGTLTTNIEGTDYSLVEKEGKLFIDGYQVVEPEEAPIEPNFPSDAVQGDSVYAYCQVCKKNVDWICKTNGISTIQDGGHHHYFIASDRTLTWGAGTIDKATTVCLHMNGTTWGGNSRVLVTGDSTLNIFGGGKLVSSATGSSGILTGTLTVFAGVANVYDVTIEGSEAIPALCTQYAQATINLLEGSEAKGTANINKGNLVLGSTAKSGEIKVSADGKLTVKADFTGSAVASFAAALEENLVPAANGVAEGDFTGSLTTVSGDKITNLEGRLSVEATAQPQTGVLVLDANNHGYCEHCKTIVEWKAAGVSGLSTVSDGAHHHLYLTANFNKTWGYMTLTAGTKMCLHLNGFNIEQRGRIYLGNAELSIIGNGRVASVEAHTNNELNTGAVTVNNATLNIYGGTYDAPVEGIPAIRAQHGTSVVNIYGGTFNGKINALKGNISLGGNATVADLQVAEAAKLTVKADFTGMAAVAFAAPLVDSLVPAANGAAEGDFTGTLVTASGEKIVNQEGRLLVDAGKLLLDENGMGYCQHCATIVQWKAAGVSGLSSIADGQHHHLYMTANFDKTWGYLTLNTKTTLCLHLNGFNIEQRGRILVANSELNIMGKGRVASIAESTNPDLNSGAITNRKSVVRLYGGTYDAPVEGIPAIKLEYAESQVMILGATVTGKVDVQKGNVILGGSGNAADLQISAEGKLTVQADWTGTANVAFAAALAEGKVPAANGVSEGTFTGTLIFGEVKLIGKDGGLETTSAA